jgi:hypothetical protein
MWVSGHLNRTCEAARRAGDRRGTAKPAATVTRRLVVKVNRCATVIALGSACVLAPGAQAATKPAVKPVCNLVTDAAQDTFAVRSQDSEGKYGPQVDELDILSMDLASNAKTLTGVIRVAKLATTTQTAPGGTDYRIAFSLPGQDPTVENFFLDARTTSAGVPSFLLGLRTVVAGGQSTTAKLADATGTFDLAKNQVRIHVPLGAVKSAADWLVPGKKLSFSGLDQTSARQVLVNPATNVGTATFADVAASDKIYTAGALSCVTPGK